MTRNKNKLDTFGQRLRNARLTAGWTQKELASESGLTQSAIGNYESGQRVEPTGAALVRLSRALRVTPEWLSQGSTSPAVGATDPGPPGQAVPRTAQAAAWPFQKVSAADCASLSAAERRTLEALISAFIQSCRDARR